MELKTKLLPEGDRLEGLLLICWYITVASAAFGDCLLRISLPIGGHLFLFRIAILATCFLYLLTLIRRRENPFRGLSRIELCFVAAAACMLVYGAASALWSLSLGAWFSKFFTMCQMFALVFLFLKLCRDEKVMRVTLLLAGVSTLICALGGFVECFHGPFFDTPYRNHSYVFFNKGMYAPIFTFYNPNGLSAYILFILEVLYLYTAFCWERIAPPRNRRLLYLLSVCMGFTLFLCCADGGRLCILAIPVILCGLAVWLVMRYKRGLVVFLGLALCLAFIYVGENYNEVKYRAEQAGERIQEFFTPGETPSDTEKPTPPPPPDKNLYGSLYTIAPAITGSGKTESVQESDATRATLLKNAFVMLFQSKGLGVGLGNAEIRIAEFGNTEILAVHCFIMEVFAEFGVFAILPLLILVLLIFKVLFTSLYAAIKDHRREPAANILLLLFTILSYPLLSTANSSSWGIVAMWLYVALVLLYSGRMEGGRALSKVEATS